MKFYVTHYTPLIQRKKHMIYQFENFLIKNYEFIEDFDKEKLSREQISKFNNITPSECSLFLKHIECYKKLLESDDDLCIITEDDSIFDKQLFDKLEQIKKELKEYTNYIIFCSDSCDIHTKEKITKDKLVYYAEGSRGTGFYIITKHAARILYDNFNHTDKVSLAIDHWLNKFNNNIDYFYSEPYVALQGSVSGLFRSSIR